MIKAPKKPNLNSKISKKSLAIPIGAGLILFSLLVNTWSVSQILTVDGKINSNTVRLAIYSTQFFLLLSGIYLIRKRPQISPADLFLSLGSSVFALGVAALAAQFLYNPEPIVSGWTSATKPAEANNFGTRGRTIKYADDDFVILLIGDSQVECASCAFDYIPEARLEHHMVQLGKKVKVASLGTSGYGQDQQYLSLQNYYRHGYRADLVVVWETPTNDIWNNMFPTHWPTNANPKPTYWLENNELKGPTSQIGEKIAEPKVKLLSLIYNFLPSTSERKRQRDDEWESRLPPAYKPATSFDGPVKDTWQKCWDGKVGFWDGENFETEKNHLAFALTPASDRMKYGLELSNRLLKEMKSLAREKGGNLMTFYVTPPDALKGKETYILEDKYYTLSEEQFYLNMAHWNKDISNFNIKITNEKWKVHLYDNTHFNEHATDEAMEILALKINEIISGS